MPPIHASTRAQEALSTARLDWRVSSELVALARMSLLFQSKTRSIVERISPMPTRSAWCRVLRAHLPSVPSTSLASRSHRVRIQMQWIRLSSLSWYPHSFAAQTNWMPDRAANHVPMAQLIVLLGRRAFRLQNATQTTHPQTTHPQTTQYQSLNLPIPRLLPMDPSTVAVALKTQHFLAPSLAREVVRLSAPTA